MLLNRLLKYCFQEDNLKSSTAQNGLQAIFFGVVEGSGTPKRAQFGSVKAVFQQPVNTEA